MIKICPKCGKNFNANKCIRIYDGINNKWIKMTSGDWATGACSRKCHVKINEEYFHENYPDEFIERMNRFFESKHNESKTI